MSHPCFSYPSYPKARIYRRHRLKGGPETWEYVCSTTRYPSREEALLAFLGPGRDHTRYRVELAATHGYYIED